MSQVPTEVPVLKDEAFTLAYLQENEVCCPACGYNLHALTMPRCPECGRTLLLQVTTPARLSKAWLMALIGACAGAAVGLWALTMDASYEVFALWQWAWRPWPIRYGVEWFYRVSLAMLLWPALLLWLQGSFYRFPGWVQWLAAAGFALIAIVLLSGLVVMSVVW